MQKILARIGILVMVLLLLEYGAFPIPTRAATVNISPSSGIVGTTVTISSSDFSANETVTIRYDGSTIVTTPSTITANSTGGWSATFTVPASRSGSHTVTAFSSSTGTVTTSFIVTPSISVSPTRAGPRSTVTITGTGFGANETDIKVTYDGTTVATTPTVPVVNTDGGWTATFVVPVSTSGGHTIGASGSTTTTAATTTFTVAPTITVNPVRGAPWSSVTITASGFSASEAGISVTWDGQVLTTNPSSPVADTQGGWTATFVVPVSYPGSHTIVASGSSGLASVSFTVTAGITVSPTSAAPGSTVTVSGSAFNTNEAGIRVTYDGVVQATTPTAISADSQGGWSATLVVPASRSGAHNVGASGASTSSITTTFYVTPGIFVSRSSGAPESSVTVTGSGFGAGERSISVTYDGVVVASVPQADAYGGWTTAFVVPASPSGSPHTIDAHSNSTLATVVADQTFTITPGISINRSSGAPESSVTVTGSGFAANEKSIKITFNNEVVASASGITANPNGSWSASFVIPASACGSYSIGASGSVTQATSVSEIDFIIGAGITLNPANSHVGATVIIEGCGFAANSPLRFTYDGQAIPAEGLTTDTSGSFTKSIIVPKSTAGSHTVEAIDGENNATKATFTMESTAPSAPTLIYPGDSNTVGILGGITPTFRWSNVTDPSGATFVLQVDMSPDFTQIILEKTDISGSRYTITSAEALPRGEYYWRVKAVDGASNQSAWSQAWMFKSGLMSLTTLIIFIILAVAVAGGVAYFLLVRRQRMRWEPMPLPEYEMPQQISRRLRLMEPEPAPREQPAPRRLALPQAVRRGKVLSAEDMGRLKVIAGFTQSLPLAEPGYTANWVVDLAQTSMEIEVSNSVYEQLLKGELQVRYEPAWMRHPTYKDLLSLLQGQPVLQDLDAFITGVNRCASESVLLLQEIYRDAMAEIPSDLLGRDGWGFIAAVYSDAMNWFLGKSLREPSERDYSIKPSGGTGEEPAGFCLWGGETTYFAESLIEAPDEEEALRLRALHLKLRRSYRNSDRARQLVGMMAQLEVQRSRLVDAFSQFGRFTQ